MSNSFNSISLNKLSLERVNRTLELITKWHKEIENSKILEAQCLEICKILIDDVQYKLTWIGYLKYDVDASIIPVVHAKYNKGALEAANIHWDDDQNEQGPTGIVTRTGQVCINQNIQATPSYSPWRLRALEYGYRSSVTLPCILKGKVLCVLNIYASAPNAFDEKELSILAFIAKAIAYGLNYVSVSEDNELSQQKIEGLLLQTVEAMAAILDKRDPYTAGHQRRVVELGTAIAKELGWSKDRIQGLYLGGIIHDIGKIAVPAEILNRPGRLSPAEFEIIKVHPQIGLEIVSSIDFPWPVKEIVYQHHERLDGSGYPQGLTDVEIKLEAKVIAVCDVVEAIASHRPYRPSLGIDAALDVIKEGRGTLYDSEIVDICIKLFEQQDFKWNEK
jgi:putative nucleotidyltransferase with HDIG domain